MVVGETRKLLKMPEFSFAHDPRPPPNFWITTTPNPKLQPPQNHMQEKKTLKKQERQWNQRRSGEVSLYETDIKTSNLRYKNHPRDLYTLQENILTLHTCHTSSKEEDRTLGFWVSSDLEGFGIYEPNKRYKQEEEEKETRKRKKKEKNIRKKWCYRRERKVARTFSGNRVKKTSPNLRSKPTTRTEIPTHLQHSQCLGPAKEIVAQRHPLLSPTPSVATRDSKPIASNPTPTCLQPSPSSRRLV